MKPNKRTFIYKRKKLLNTSKENKAITALVLWTILLSLFGVTVLTILLFFIWKSLQFLGVL